MLELHRYVPYEVSVDKLFATLTIIITLMVICSKHYLWYVQ